MPPAGVQEKACKRPVDAVAEPTTWPLAFTADAELEVPPNVPRSVIAASPGFQVKACEPLSPATSARPTTTPLSLTAAAELDVPPRVPKSTMPPAPVHENACVAPSVFWAYPTTVPLAFTSTATLVEPPNVPRSTIPPARVQEKAR